MRAASGPRSVSSRSYSTRRVSANASRSRRSASSSPSGGLTSYVRSSVRIASCRATISGSVRGSARVASGISLDPSCSELRLHPQGPLVGSSASRVHRVGVFERLLLGVLARLVRRVAGDLPIGGGAALPVAGPGLDREGVVVRGGVEECSQERVVASRECVEERGADAHDLGRLIGGDRGRSVL